MSPKRKQVRRIVSWQWPPRTSKKVLATRERFPGKELAEKGARWLDFSLATDWPPRERKIFAKKCFQEAINQCNYASLEAKKAKNATESARLTEIARWLETQYLNTL